mmetsp:Transcript_38464/g.90454  ORF Transcript_38464/g.90454 Transcript_38464/m.90454 type:complete len:198 (-) Transcript_38464:3-596(-)
MCIRMFSLAVAASAVLNAVRTKLSVLLKRGDACSSTSPFSNIAVITSSSLSCSLREAKRSKYGSIWTSLIMKAKSSRNGCMPPCASTSRTAMPSNEMETPALLKSARCYEAEAPLHFVRLLPCVDDALCVSCGGSGHTVGPVILRFASFICTRLLLPSSEGFHSPSEHDPLVCLWVLVAPQIASALHTWLRTLLRLH